MQKRSDIQGLRALAVSLVVLNHVNIIPVYGGYVGVDVFFVISGFLITSGIVSEYAQNYRSNGGIGWFSLRAFYLRRVRRILPLAIFVLGVTVTFSFLFLNFLKAHRILVDSMWSILFLANVHFIDVQSDYFQQNYAPSPLQHYWSLAVEEQFYLFYPTLLLACMSLRGLRVMRFRLNWLKRVTIVTTIVTLISFTWAIISTYSTPKSSYFSTSTRIWELGIGALLAVFYQNKPKVLSLFIRNAMSLIGCFMILFSAVEFSPATPFPSAYTLLPTIGTAMIIRSGMNSSFDKPTFVEKVSSLRPILFLGDISYSIYLWHLPFLTLSSQIFLETSSRIYFKLLILILITLVSTFTYIVIENPMQKWIHVPTEWYSKKFSSNFSFYKSKALPNFRVEFSIIVSVILMALSVTLINLPLHKIDSSSTGVAVPVQSSLESQSNLGLVPKPYKNLQNDWLKKIKQGNELQKLPSQTAPSLDQLTSDWTKYQFKDSATNLPNAKTVYFYGDSVAGRFPIFSKIVFNGWNQHIRSFPGCGVPRSFSGKEGIGFNGFDCDQEWKKFKTEISAQKPDLIVVVSGVDKGGDLEKTIDFLSKNSKNLLFLSGRPTQVSLKDCLKDKSTFGKNCFGLQDDSFLKNKNLERSIVLSKNGVFLDYSQWLCDSRKCPPVIDNNLVLLDDIHPSTPILIQISSLFLSYAKENKKLSEIIFGGIEFRDEVTVNSPVIPKVRATTKEISGNYLTSLTSWQKKISEGSNLQELPKSLSPSLSEVDNLSIYWKKCFGAGKNGVSCMFGSPAAPHTAIVMGDSFAIAALPMIISALSSNGWKIVALTKARCMIAAVTPVLEANSTKEFSACPSYRNWAFDYIKKNPPDLIVISDLADITIKGPDGATIERPGSTGNRFWLQQLDYSLAKIAASVNKKFVYFGTVPRSEPFVDCVKSDLSLKKSCAGKPSSIASTLIIQNQITTKYGGLFVDPAEWLCYKSICPLIIDNSPVRPDGRHLGETLATKLGPLFREKLRENNLI